MKKAFFLLTALALFLNVSAASFGVQRHPRVNSIPVSRSAVRDGVGMHRLASQMAASVDTKYDFSSSIADGWSSSATPQGYETTGSARGTQFASAATLTLKGVSNVTKVVVVCSANTDKNSISVSVGGTSIGSANLSKENNKTQTFTCSAASGDVVISISRSEKSVWIKSVTVTGDAIELPDPSERLDPGYVYGSTVEILPQDSLGKVKIDTIVDNVLLSIPNGAFYSADIRAYAGSSLMLVAAKNIKAVAIDGSVKKNFSATTSSGTMTYLTDSEGASSGTPVLLIKDVNAKSVTIKVTAQLQCQKIVVYFDANPDVDIEGGEQGGGDDEGGDTPPTPPTPSGDVTITGLNYADAVFHEDEENGDYWEFDFYNDLEEMEGEFYMLSPFVYFVCNESTTSGTKIAGTWTAYEAGYFETDDDEIGIFTDEEAPVGSLTVTCVSAGVYNFAGSFVGTDGKTYTWTLNNMTVDAYNGETGDGITLTDGSTPTPPTPVGDEITPEQALEIGKALADNATTSETYRVVGIVSYANSYNTQYGSQTFSMSSDGADSKSNFKAYQCTVTSPGVKVGNKVAVTGKILKYVDKNGTTIEIKQGIVEILDGPVPPTPVGTEINVAKAEEIAAALADNTPTTDTYTVIGYAVTAYDPNADGTQNMWMADAPDTKGNFQAKKTKLTDGTILKDEYIAVTGKIEKNVYNNKTTFQIYLGSARHLSPTALMKLFPGVSVKKLMMQHKVLILHNGHFYDMNGKVIQ